MTPAFSLIISATPVEVSSSSRRGTYGCEAGLEAGEAMAELIAAGKTLELITAFDLPRLADGRLVGEKGTAVGH